jgi:CheY-like chemotaxis protein
VKVTLLLIFYQNDNLLEIKVEDSGLGMDEEVQINMYKIFSNEKECKKSLKVSTGLGLHVAKLITNAMGGEIKFKSCKQKGTTATITMKVSTPMTEVEKFEQSISQNAYKNGLTKLKRSLEKVLVVDDNMSNVYVLKKMLKSLGVDSDEAHNGAEAVDRFRKNPYRLIFMDVNMPVMNGLDASLLIIKEKVPTVIIALTAQDEISELDYKSYGINKWVVKPISLKSIKEIISQL